MSGRIPVVSGRDLIRWLVSLGYRVVRQRGSHVRLERRSHLSVHNITVPNHREIAKGTLNGIVTSVSRVLGKEKATPLDELGC